MSQIDIKKKTPLFDRIFKPQHITLDNGHSVNRPRSRMPLILICLAIVIAISVYATDTDLNMLFSRINQVGVILGQIFHPNMAYFSKVIEPLVETIKMSLIGTVIGCLLGLPMAIFASANINKNKTVVVILRGILAIMRSVPTLIYASIFALVYSLGTFAGTLAIIVFTLGIVAKMLYESIETIDMKPYEAMISIWC